MKRSFCADIGIRHRLSTSAVERAMGSRQYMKVPFPNLHYWECSHQSSSVQAYESPIELRQIHRFPLNLASLLPVIWHITLQHLAKCHSRPHPLKYSTKSCLQAIACSVLLPCFPPKSKSPSDCMADGYMLEVDIYNFVNKILRRILMDPLLKL